VIKGKAFMKRITQIIFMLLMILGSLCFTRCGKQEEPEPENNTVTDYDGNVYATVKIFTNIWMAENLRASRLNDGKTIGLVPDNWNWDFLEEPKRCYYNNDGPANRDVYGQLYNYYAVNTKRLCPVGWHVPTKQEWATLIGYLGGYSVAGGKLKESGTTHWSSPNTGADNSSSFKALPGGYRTDDGFFRQIGYNGIWWSDNNPLVYGVVKMTYNSSSADLLYVYEAYGASVRCVKDN
jgi:uncharacterized protein (TIGR02145 family)